MREGGKKTFKKKTTLNLFLEKLMRATKKIFVQISRKVNEGDEIKNFCSIWKKVNEGDEKNSKKT